MVFLYQLIRFIATKVKFSVLFHVNVKEYLGVSYVNRINIIGQSNGQEGCA